ncbi:hypothetical protein P5_0009 [Aeromonas phage P5]|nr:hypothetical protein P5_0009 [Aeromonas phage P5]
MVDFNKLLSGVEKGAQGMLNVYERSLPQVENATQAVVDASGAVAGAGAGVKDAVNAHKDAVLQAGQASDQLAEAQGALEKIKLEETYKADTAFRPQLQEAIKAQDNLEGIRRLQQMQNEYDRNNQKIAKAVQKENTNPIAAIFDGTWSERKALEAANVALKDGMAVQAGAVQLGSMRMTQMLSNESNLRKLMSQREFEASTDLATAKVVQAKALNKQKVTESDLNDMQVVYGLSKDQVSAMTTALNAQASMASAGIDMYKSVINTQLLKANLGQMQRQFKKEDDYYAEIKATSDELATMGIKITPERLMTPENLTTEEQGAVRTALTKRAFGDNKIQTYNSFVAKAAYDSSAQSKLMAGTQIWYQLKASQLDAAINDEKDMAKKTAMMQQRSKLSNVPVTDQDKAEVVSVLLETEQQMEKVDASPQFAMGMYALNDPRATLASGERATFQELKANGTLNLTNPVFFDSIPVSFEVAGNNPSKTVSANFDAIANNMVAKAKQPDNKFDLNSSVIQSVAEDMVRIFNFQNATANANPNIPFNPKSISLKDVDTGAGAKTFFGGYATENQTVDLSNPQTAYVMLENRIKRAILASQEAAKMAGAGSDNTIMFRSGSTKDKGGW